MLFKVMVIYGPGKKKSIEIEAESADDARMNAVIKDRLPVSFIGRCPMYWRVHSQAHKQEKPEIVNGNITWGTGKYSRKLLILVSAVNPIKGYLEGLKWDGIKRAETLPIITSM